MNDIFKGLKVIELASVLAGPAVGMFFAELGAEVIKIENKKTKGDVTRNWHISSEDKNKTAAYYHSINYNKKSQFWDLTEAEDYKKLLNELQDTDILISNFNEQTAEKFKVSYKNLSSIFPRLIYAQLTGFVHEKDRPAYDIVLQAESGFLSMCGLNETSKARLPVALIDILAAHQLKEGILIAMLKRVKSNTGSKIECTLEESAISSLANQATNYLIANHIPKPLGTIHPNISPYGDIFKTKDDQEIVLSIGTNKQFYSLCNILKTNELIDDERFITNPDRVKNRIELIEKLSIKIKDFNCSDLLKKAKSNKVPLGQIKNLEQVFETKTGKSMILESEDGTKRVKTVAFKIS